MRGEVYWLREMVTSCHAIAEYLEGAIFETLEREGMRRDAIVHRLAVIGESVAYVSAGTRSLLPNVPWSSIRQMRNLLLHEFHRVDLSVVWDTATQDVPALLTSLETIVRPEE